MLAKAARPHASIRSWVGCIWSMKPGFAGKYCTSISAAAQVAPVRMVGRMIGPSLILVRRAAIAIVTKYPITSAVAAIQIIGMTWPVLITTHHDSGIEMTRTIVPAIEFPD